MAKKHKYPSLTNDNPLSGIKEELNRDSNITDEDVLNILEITRFALKNTEICHYVADKMDMSDEVVTDTLKKIETIMNK